MATVNRPIDYPSRSNRVFPGGSLGEYNLPNDMSIVLSRGEGCHVFDTEGKRYLDMTMGWGSAILGHSHPAIVSAVRDQAAQGSNFAYVNEPALQLAEEMVRCIACAEKVRFCASGTEATMYLTRLARAHYGRAKIIKFEGAYHGANDTGVMSLFPKELRPFPQAEPGSAGVPRSVQEDTLIAPYNDLATTRRILADHAGKVAGIIVEPLHRCTKPLPGFLAGLRELANEFDCLLLFDEVVTGFRLAYGGAQEYYGVIPDLAAFGKGLGGGYPIGAIAGRSEVMDLLDESRYGEPDYVWFASSIGGNPISASAAHATLGVLGVSGKHEELFAIGSLVRDGLRQVLSDLGIEAQVLGDGPICAISFTDQPIIDYRTAHSADSQKARTFLLGLFRNGIFLNPMSTKLYLSLAHTADDIGAFLEVAKFTLREVASS